MKEKTFEELIRPHEKIEKMKGYISCQDTEKLLQQVREATIAECVEILRDPNIPKTRMESLPTDRIKTEK